MGSCAGILRLGTELGECHLCVTDGAEARLSCGFLAAADMRRDKMRLRITRESSATIAGSGDKQASSVPTLDLHNFICSSISPSTLPTN